MQLHKLLDFKELREFATLLKQYREDLKVDDFLRQLKDLYGKQRAFLIPGKLSTEPYIYRLHKNRKPAPSIFIQPHKNSLCGVCLTIL